jgi:hypothetical protein
MWPRLLLWLLPLQWLWPPASRSWTSPGGRPASSAAARSTISTPAASSGVTYYIVGSQEEAARIEQGIATAAAEVWQTGYQQVAHNGLVQVVIETAEQEMQFQSALMALQQADPYASNVSVVDLRR